MNRQILTLTTKWPEVRDDWYHGHSGFVSPGVPGSPPNQPYNDNQDTNQFLFGLDAIYQF